MSLAIVVAPTLMIVHNVGIFLHGRSPQLLSFPVNIDVVIVVLRRHGCRPHGGNGLGTVGAVIGKAAGIFIVAVILVPHILPRPLPLIMKRPSEGVGESHQRRRWRQQSMCPRRP